MRPLRWPLCLSDFLPPARDLHASSWGTPGPSPDSHNTDTQVLGTVLAHDLMMVRPRAYCLEQAGDTFGCPWEMSMAGHPVSLAHHRGGGPPGSEFTIGEPGLAPSKHTGSALLTHVAGHQCDRRPPWRPPTASAWPPSYATDRAARPTSAVLHYAFSSGLL